MNDTPSAPDKAPDKAPGEDPESTEPEPPPMGRAPFSGMFTDPVPFGSPPAEEIVLAEDAPWELRDAK